MAAVFFIVGIPMAGLAIDLGTFYLIQTRLQTAVDSAALAGARALARGLNGAAQQTAAQTAALAYMRANFPSDFMGVNGLNIPTPVVDQTATNFRTVQVTATVNAPQIFMRWLGGTFSSVRANALATRRDVNVVIVMDRSGSLETSGSCAPLKLAAQNFVNKFSEGRDAVGLVTFASSSRPDFPAANNFQSASPNVDTTLGNVTCTGFTNSSQGLWMGYQELARLSEPASLNVILFFTDGDPTAVTSQVGIRASSTCTSKADKVGVLTATGNGRAPTGLLQYLAAPQPTLTDTNLIASSAGCAFAGRTSNVSSDIGRLPSTDYWGNNMASGYLPVTLTGGNFDPSNGDNLHNGIINAAENAGSRIRNAANPGNGYAPLPGVVIFSIGLGGSGAASDDFLLRVSNDRLSPVWSSSTATGLYIRADNATELSSAFNRVASEMLRLAQ